MKEQLENMNRTELKAWCTENNVEFSSKDNTKRILSKALKSLETAEPKVTKPKAVNKPSKEVVAKEEVAKVVKSLGDSNKSVITYKGYGENITVFGLFEKKTTRRFFDKEERERVKALLDAVATAPSKSKVQELEKLFSNPAVPDKSKVTEIVLKEESRKLMSDKYKKAIKKKKKKAKKAKKAVVNSRRGEY